MKKFFFGMTVLLSVSLVLSGCPTDTETETKYVTVTEQAPGSFQPPAGTVAASSDAALAAMLADTSGVYRDIAYEGVPGVDITVPAGKTLYLRNGSGITLTTNKVVVAGRLVVYGGTGFTPSSFLTGTGTLVVESGSLNVSDDKLFTGTTALGGVTVQKAATLATTATVATAEAVQAWVGRKGSGSISLTVTTLTPSATLTAIGSPAAIEYAGWTMPSVRVTNDVAETAESLTVGAGVNLTTSATLGSVKTLTVNGGLTVTASSAAFNSTDGVTVTLGSKASVTVDTIAKLAANITVPAGAQFNAKAITDANSKTVTYTKGSQNVISDIDLAFSGMSTDGWTLANNIALTAGQSVIIPAGAKIVVPAGKKITNAGTIVLEATAILVLATPQATTGGASIEGTGTLAAGATTITGPWEAVGTATAASKVTIASAAAGATITAAANATGLTATAAGATITQAAAASNVLTIAADTTVALGGTATKVGEIVLKNSNAANATDNGKLALAGTITTGNTAVSNQSSGALLSNDGTTEVSNATTYSKIGVALLAGDGTNAKVVATNDPESDGKTSVAGKIAKLLGASGATITGGDNTATVDGTKDGKISSETATAADSSS